LRTGPEHYDELLLRAASWSGPTLGLAQLSLLPPVPDPHAIWAIALNYHAHIAEGSHQRPDQPMMFLRLPISQVGHGEALIRPADSSQFDYEGELAVVIGRCCFQVDCAAARDFVLGYACYNEGSVREWQRHTSQITPGKNFVASGAFGPWLVTRDEVPDIYAQSLVTRVNGVEMQRARLGEMLFRIEEIIAYLSHIAPLLPGDVILTGTPGGVGLRRTPQRFLWQGDRVEIEISRVGTLCNPVVDGKSPRSEIADAPELRVAQRLSILTAGPAS
ncbi:MAG: fumarylacetoacetate hydrolase family protein, partial [Steroidobacteraceae bacterium]